jgi:hypothetical protein
MAVEITKSPNLKVIVCAATHAEALLNELNEDYVVANYRSYEFDGQEKVHALLVHKRTMGMPMPAKRGLLH